jgi:hypothetical protein
MAAMFIPTMVTKRSEVRSEGKGDRVARKVLIISVRS